MNELELTIMRALNQIELNRRSERIKRGKAAAKTKKKQQRQH